jgi:transposase-like protein
MEHSSRGRHAIGAARRGQIIQRVIVDGWTIANTAAAFDIPPRLVRMWIADYRRYGMASLRRTPRRTVAAEIVTLQLVRPIAAILRCLLRGRLRLFADRRRLAEVTFEGERDDRRGGSP